MVRYRLLFLTSVPVVLTLLALVGVTFYWALTYTWQSALMNVRSDLAVAHHSLELLKKEQQTRLKSLVNSYEFQTRWRNDEAALVDWVGGQGKIDGLDFVVIHPASVLGEFGESDQDQLLKGNQTTFFEVLTTKALERLDDDLLSHAQIPLLESDEIEQRGLVSRSLLPIFDQDGYLEWIVDAGVLLNNSTSLVDRIRDLVYAEDTLPEGSIGTVTIFMDDVRVSTNVPLDSANFQGRAIGTRVSREVQESVLQNGQLWVDRAFVYDDWYVSAYEPIYDHRGIIVGMLYVGYLEWPLVKIMLINIAQSGAVILLVLIISSLIVYRGSRQLFKPIEKIHHVVEAVQLGQDKRIGELRLDPDHELQILGRQFDSMLDLLQQRNDEIKAASDVLEEKVEKRTQSLHEKTLQLEQHIRLLKQARSKLLLNEKLAALGELTAGIAHEINNPTAVIMGNVELIQSELGTVCDNAKEEFETIYEQLDRICTITRSLLQYTRQGGIQDEVTWQHLNPLVNESLSLVRSGTKKMKVTIEADLRAKCSVEVNRHQLLQVLVNLQMNGIHAMDDQGLLKVSTFDWVDLHGNVLGAVVEVEDHGCGIDEGKLTRIFDPFYTTRRTGTGLGLSVSQGIISQIGGEIRVRSREGKGSVFSVYLKEKADSINLIDQVIV